MHFKLTAKENRNTGEIGWMDSRIPRSSDAFEPLTYPIGLAHDCLEHFAFQGVADEIEAHGAMYWIRYEGGWCNSKALGQTLSMESFASEWINLYNGLQAEPYLPAPRNTRPLDSYIESDIDEIIERGRASIRTEYDNADAALIDRIAGVFRAYFRTGYRKAIRRYKGLSSCEVAYLYTALADAFERQPCEYEGQEISVRVDLRTQRVRIEEIYLTEY